MRVVVQKFEIFIFEVEDRSYPGIENWLKHTLAWKTDSGVRLDFKPVVITKYKPEERKF